MVVIFLEAKKPRDRCSDKICYIFITVQFFNSTRKKQKKTFNGLEGTGQWPGDRLHDEKTTTDNGRKNRAHLKEKNAWIKDTSDEEIVDKTITPNGMNVHAKNL